MSRFMTLLLLGVAAVCVGTAGAAAISWSDLIPNALPENSGIVVEAVNVGGPAVANVGGIDFKAGDTGAILEHSNIAVVFASSWDPAWGPCYVEPTGDANLDTVLSTHRWTSTTPVTFTLMDLIPGVPYEIQLYFSDDRDCCWERYYYYSDGLGNDSEVFARGDDVSVIGSFIADATIQSITMTVS